MCLRQLGLGHSLRSWFRPVWRCTCLDRMLVWRYTVSLDLSPHPHTHLHTSSTLQHSPKRMSPKDTRCTHCSPQTLLCRAHSACTCALLQQTPVQQSSHHSVCHHRCSSCQQGKSRTMLYLGSTCRLHMRCKASRLRDQCLLFQLHSLCTTTRQHSHTGRSYMQRMVSRRR